jgi:starch-binding outer membrane protein, SusD/RagB family
MKQFKIQLLAGAVLMLVLGACSKRLDKFPESGIEVTQSFKTMQDAKSWNNGLYSALRGRVYGDLYMITQDVQADQLNAGLDYGNRNGSPHRWSDFLAGDYTIRDVWQFYYRGIANANQMIAGLPTIPTTTPAETAELNRYKGDAYLVRAWYYHQLVLRYAKAYEPASAATDPGVPLLLTYDLNTKAGRASLKAVYDQILADIDQAKTLLAAVPGVQGSTRFTKDAALALEARVRLSTQDWAGAKAAADAVIATGLYPLINTAAAYKAYWSNDTKTESIVQLQAIAPSELTNSMGSYLGYVPSTGKYDPDWIPTQGTVDMYTATDIRKAAYLAQLPVRIQGVDYPNTWLVNKYPGNPALYTGATTNYQHQPKLFRIAEMYLISAEAGARSGNATMDADALVKLNALRVARGVPALAGLTGATLFAAVKTERTLELAFEGFRLFDLKRWHQGFTRTTPQNTAMLTAGAGYYGLAIPADDPKFTWGIPTNEVTINPNISQNPGW